ncbi:MAG: citrate:proton symporter [Spirochaetales bacterium]|jgi:CitMHS family citrate-Mg2+:H+ or citrate-Ca2+:H+ symporter|nr:citrate:proton symporter [Spirochaetales bacterium]
MLGVFGFLIVGIIVFLLLKKITVPSIAFIAVPTVIVLIAGYTGFLPETALMNGKVLESFSFLTVGRFIKLGVRGTYETAALFIFSITFFCLMDDAGVFDRIIGGLAKKAGNNVILVCMLTTLIAMIGHLDGSGASTFLITIPAMYPVFKRLKMRNTSLMLIATSAMGVMNLLPWGGPTLRAASVIDMDAGELWQSILPMQGIGIVLAFAVSYLVGRREISNGAGYDPDYTPVLSAGGAPERSAGDKSFQRPKLFWFNIALTLGAVATLCFVKIPAFYIFMIATAITLLVNYPGGKLQSARVGAHAKGAMMMASTLLAAGVLLGILRQSGMMDAMGGTLVSVIPPFLGPYTAIIIGIFSAPLALAFDTDSYYYGVLPVVVKVAEAYGVPPVAVAITMVVCRNLACFISPMVPATLLGCGLAEVEINEHIKTAFFWVWGMSMIMLVSGVLLGIISTG